MINRQLDSVIRRSRGMRKAVPFIALALVLLAGCAATPSLDYTPPSHPSTQSTPTPSATPAAANSGPQGFHPCSLLTQADAESILGESNIRSDALKQIEDADVDHCDWGDGMGVGLTYNVGKLADQKAALAEIDFRRKYLNDVKQYDPKVGDSSVGAVRTSDVGGDPEGIIYFSKGPWVVYADVIVAQAPDAQVLHLAQLLLAKLN